MKRLDWPVLRENAGKVFVDVGKLVLGSIALGGVLRGEIERVTLLLAGFGVGSVLIVAGVIMLSIKIRKD